MCYWGWLAAGGQDRDGSFAHVVLAGTALELLHVFALIHDDVMDESASRRGQPSIHTLAAHLHLLSSARGSAQRFGESSNTASDGTAVRSVGGVVRSRVEASRYSPVNAATISTNDS